MNKSLITKLIGAVTVLVAAASHATPIYLNNGIDYGSNGSTRTGAIDELGYTATRATSIYRGSPSVVGTKVIDTNETSVMNSYGFSPGNKKTLAGTTKSFQYPSFPTGSNIDALNEPSDTNGFTNGQGAFKFGSNFGGRLWGLTYSYTIEGVTTATGVEFTSGYFNMFYQDGGAAKQVLRMNLAGSDLESANLSLFGHVSFDFNGDGTDDADDFVKNFWQTDSGSFYKLWLANADAVSWALDTNVDPPLPTAGQLYRSSTGDLIRQSNLDGSLVFTVNQFPNEVPEPGSVALIGIALAGMEVVRKRSKGETA
ncbi:PEP-CTERM sorting domain-containing protein [Pseudorhodoferax sp.]|uniref:PEP-CTERM sorting domain-containing protein n=1 Tax=Pseudorhodoferax sp. TaxID=1993553 RepID=UPI002DD63F86|nr:PEP-CTERM sorting domain-containing protein [Pseudorhodoferax sp.]